MAKNYWIPYKNPLKPHDNAYLMIELIVTMGPSENMMENMITKYKINSIRFKNKPKTNNQSIA